MSIPTALPTHASNPLPTGFPSPFRPKLPTPCQRGADPLCFRPSPVPPPRACARGQGFAGSYALPSDAYDETTGEIA